MIAPDASCSVTYFKRYRMEIDLLQSLPALAELPPDYFFVAWDEALLPLHSEVKYRSFIEEIDATVFPSLATRHGCNRLMHEIRHKAGFCPESTWLIATREETCGTVQGVRETSGFGAIQNLGITRHHRGKGLGKALLLQSLHGFRCAGVQRVHLEVTSQNGLAIQLYRNLGFRCRKTIYRAVDVLADVGAGHQESGWLLQ
jgi:ribosomal protein S18 acetylase RimI-like enzyme